MKKIRLIPFFSAVLVIILLSGCALYPAFQVAGTAMTGYDAIQLADDYLPRDSVKGGSLRIVRDKQLERRLRERLQMNDIPVSAHVIDSRAYLVGNVSGRAEADRAVKTAATVEGIRVITCKFYPRISPMEEERDQLVKAHLALELKRSPQLRDADVRVEVIQANAIVLGRTATRAQKSTAMNIISKDASIGRVVDYLTVCPTDDPAKDNVASN